MPHIFYLFSIFTALLSPFYLSAQTSTPLYSSQSGFIAPLDIPLILSGNFGEFRGNHFHTGLDFKTQGKEGFPVLAVADGVVSRVKVRPGGYGRALYLKHADGTTTVYAHLSRYALPISDWLLLRQYSKRSFSIDSRPATEISFSVGDTIGWSGNSGSSGGPHLHFEVRDENEKPINPLQWGFKIADSKSPKVGSLRVIPIDSLGLEYRSRALEVKSDGVFEIPSGNIRLAVEAYDQLDGASNVCGVYSLEVFVDGDLYSSFFIDTLDFSTNKDMNAHSYYPEWKSSRTQIHRFTPLPGNRLSIYEFTPVVLLEVVEDSTMNISVRCSDAHGNTTTKGYTLLGGSSFKQAIASSQNASVFCPATPSTVVTLEDGGVEVVWPMRSFYNMETASLQVFTDGEFFIGPEDAPLAKSFRVNLNNLEGDLSKLVAVRISEKGSRLGVNICESKGGIVSFSSRVMGRYKLVRDTIAPRLSPKFSSTPLVSNGNLVFHLEDELSGVSKVEGFIDGEWVLLRWDPKMKTVVYSVSDLHHTPGVKSQITVKVEDGVGNESFWIGSVEMRK